MDRQKQQDQQAPHKQEDPAGQAPIASAKLRRKKKTLHRAPKKAETLSSVAVEASRAKPVRPSLLQYTLLFLYKNLYILGVTLLRRRLRLSRRLKVRMLRIRGACYAAAERLKSRMNRALREVLQRVRNPFHRIHEVYEQQLPEIQERRNQKKSVFQAYLPVLEAVGRFVWKILTTIFNFAAPITAAVALMMIVTNELNRPYALQLTYAGYELGYVQNEAVFNEATQLVRERLIDQDLQDIAIESPDFTVMEVDLGNESALLDNAELADMLILLSGSEIEEAFGLYIDNRFYGAVTDKDALLNEMDAIREANHTGKPNEMVQFVKRIRLTPALYPVSSLVDEARLIDLMHSNESEREVYVVQEDDTPWEIAEKNGMDYEDLLRLNPTIETDLKPGMELQTAVARPFLSVKNVYVDTYEEEIPFETVEVENSTYVRGYEETIQEGVSGLRRVVAEVTMVNGQEIGRTVIDNSEIIQYPVDKRVIVGIASVEDLFGPSSSSSSYSPSANAGSGLFIWPTVSGHATTYAGHSGNGIDIAPGGAGHPIYAAADGVVTKVVNGYIGYGHYILIDHKNGYVTRYAHNSQNLVNVGQVVRQGDVIALMGRTGLATGNHLHFEIIYNGRYMFPAEFVGWSG